MVLDASALGLMAKSPALPGGAPRNWVITPHSGEAARLLQIDTDAVEADRPAAVAALHARSGAVAVLKGARSLVCDGSRLYENTSGNAGMAKAGSGDVLAGIIGSLLAQGLQAFEAAALGVYIQGRAGDIAAKTRGRGLTAPDIADSLPAAILDYEGGTFEKGRGPVSR
jgi:NAD(P)H-hydrate epimerase